ncbi:MAG: type II toxin-antitoxin system prevent-host-death family antitoxin [Pseudomonadota bacterium]
MDRALTTTEANRRFSQLLRDVATGDSFTITLRGRPVARIEPCEIRDRREAVKRLLKHVSTMPIRTAGPWTREELYD